MQQRGRSGWWLWEQQRPVSQTTGQGERKVTSTLCFKNEVCLRCCTVDFVCSSCFLYLSELQENTEALKTKMSELRLYCDLLLKQVNKIKDSDELGDSAEVRFFEENKRGRR